MLKNAAKFLSVLILGGTIFTGAHHVNAMRRSQPQFVMHIVSPHTPNRAVDYYNVGEGVTRVVVRENGEQTGEINFEQPVDVVEAANRVHYDFPVRPVTPPEVDTNSQN